MVRPLYACTKRLEGGQMSMFIQHCDGRSHYRCRTCSDSAPVSDSVPLRVLNLYILVRDGSNTTFMRRAAYTLRLRAPPPHWAWGKHVGEGKFYDYNDAESEAIFEPQ